MLIFSRFEPNDAYKKNAYKKKRVLATPVTTKCRSWYVHRRCSWEKWIKLPSVLSQPPLQSIGLVSYLTSDLLLKISIIQPTLSFWPPEI